MLLRAPGASVVVNAEHERTACAIKPNACVSGLRMLMGVGDGLFSDTVQVHRHGSVAHSRQIAGPNKRTAPWAMAISLSGEVRECFAESVLLKRDRQQFVRELARLVDTTTDGMGNRIQIVGCARFPPLNSGLKVLDLHGCSGKLHTERLM